MSAFSVFRKSLSLTRKGAGSYVDGVWVDGANQALTIKASVQPATPEDLLSLPENRRTAAAYRLYSDFAFRGALEDAHNPDRVVIGGENYEVTAVSIWQNGVIPHYKAIATRLQE